MDEFDRLVQSLSPAELSACAEELLRLLDGTPAPKGASDALAGDEACAAAQNGTSSAETPEQRKFAAMTAAERRAALLFPGNGETESPPAAVVGTETGDAREKPGETIFPAAFLAKTGQTVGGVENTRPAVSLRRGHADAEGMRSLEMRRVSDWFRRDSRRYDSGFERY